MNVLKKALVLGAVGVMLAVPGYAKVVTGSQSDANLDLKSSFVLKERILSQNSFQFTSGLIYRKARSKSSLATSDSIASFTSSLFSGRISSKLLIGTSISFS